MNKKELRRIFKEKRYSLSATERLKLDDLLLIQFQRMSFHTGVQALLSYWPLERHAEMNTHIFTRYMELLVPNLQVAYPVVNFETSEMHPKCVTDETDFIDNTYGIPEPVNGEALHPSAIDMVFVPLLAFDKSGYRVGYGKGYYDRFLKHCRPDVLAVGFSYFDAIDKIEDTDQFDVPLSHCITPHKVYEF